MGAARGAPCGAWGDEHGLAGERHRGPPGDGPDPEGEGEGGRESSRGETIERRIEGKMENTFVRGLVTDDRVCASLARRRLRHQRSARRRLRSLRQRSWRPCPRQRARCRPSGLGQLRRTRHSWTTTCRLRQERRVSRCARGSSSDSQCFVVTRYSTPPSIETPGCSAVWLILSC